MEDRARDGGGKIGSSFLDGGGLCQLCCSGTPQRVAVMAPGSCRLGRLEATAKPACQNAGLIQSPSNSPHSCGENFIFCKHVTGSQEEKGGGTHRRGHQR